MFTERRALAEMFADLQEEKRQLKANYRTDLAAIEQRQEQVLNRLQRLDDIEREAVDIEGTLHTLAATTQELSALIPQVSAGQVIEAAAAKIAEEAKETGIEIQGQQAKQQAPTIDKTHGIARPQRITDILEEIEKVIEEAGRAVKTREIEMRLFEKYGWKWTDFPTLFSKWRAVHSSRIIKEGQKYTVAADLPEQFQDKKEAGGLKDGNERNENMGQNNIQPEVATV